MQVGIAPALPQYLGHQWLIATTRSSKALGSATEPRPFDLNHLLLNINANFFRTKPLPFPERLGFVI